MQSRPIPTYSSMFALIGAIEQFGSVDPAFDNDLEELERQFAELRLAHIE